jgi:hypothetical protein
LFNLPDLLSPLIGERPSLIFVVLLLIHVPVGLMCVVAGAVAMLSTKRSGRHPRFGEIYFWGLVVVCASVAGMAALRWHEDAYLFYLGALALLAGSIGFAARRLRWPGWMTFHIVGLSVSYIVMLTAFYVDNGPRLPLWNRLPPIAFWVLPSIIGLPLLAWSVLRYARVLTGVQSATSSLHRWSSGQLTSTRVDAPRRKNPS